LADFRSAGILATAPGGHGTEYGFEIPTLTEPGQAQAFVDARLAEGSDYIKLVMDDGCALGKRIPTLGADVVRAVIEAGRDDIALYTGNDDNIVADFLTPFRFAGKERRIVGGLLGHWSVWTKCAVELLTRCRKAAATPDLLRLGVEVTDSNAAFFDAANGFRGCIAGLHEVLRRQGLLAGIWCLDEHETLSPGQLAEIDRVYRAYPHLHDDAFVEQHRDEWLKS